MKISNANNRLFNQLGMNEMQRLTTQVPETLAVEYVKKPAFTAAELWRVQKQFRTCSSYRRSH